MNGAHIDLGAKLFDKPAMRRSRHDANRHGRSGLFASPFRPFFLAGAIWAALVIAVSLIFPGTAGLPTAMAPANWHAHEMLYGYVSAIVGGFLLTAVPNWTGRPPLARPALIALFVLWIAGRLALAASSFRGWPISAAIDLAFLPSVAAVGLCDVIATRTWRDLVVFAAVGVLLAGNLVFTAEAAHGAAVGLGVRIGLSATIFMIIVIGGRAVPGYTRAFLLERDLVAATHGKLPRPFSRFDLISILLAAAALATWTARPFSALTGALLLAAGAAHLARCLRWAGARVAHNRVMLLLHLAYGFVAVGFAVTGLASLWPAAVPQDAGIHAWSAGAIGLMTLAVMTHLLLRHAEGRIAVSPGMEVVCAAATLAAALRPVAAIVSSEGLMRLSGTLWITAFVGFALVQGPRLTRAPHSLKDFA